MAKMFIAGESVEALSGEVYEVRNPASGEVVDTVPKGNADDARRAIDAAAAAFDDWSHTTPEERAKLPQRASPDLADVLVGRPGRNVVEATPILEVA